VAVGDGQAAAAALTSKRIDALTNADVDVARLQKLGVAVRVLEPPESVRKSLIAYVYMFRKPWYQEHKTEALAILQGLIRSIIVLTENPKRRSRSATSCIRSRFRRASRANRPSRTRSMSSSCGRR